MICNGAQPWGHYSSPFLNHLQKHKMTLRGMAHETFKEETHTFGIPIRGSNEDTKIKNIPHSALLNFHGLSKEDINTFFFEFDMLCKIYDYVLNAQKLKLFPTTLKNDALC
jgi:hypothetical protein